MRILASYNIKGGVGKTATAVNLAHQAALHNYRTLIWDLDPQGAASYYFRVKSKKKDTAANLTGKKNEFSEMIKATDYQNLDIIPANFSYRNIDRHLAQSDKPTNKLKKMLKTLRQDYDYVVLDCPPSISLLSENIFVAADALILPTIPTTLSLRTLKQLVDYMKDEKNFHIALLPFFNLVDRRKTLHRLIVESPPKNLPTFLPTQIPNASDVEKMGSHRAPLATFASQSPANKAYESLWRDINMLFT